MTENARSDSGRWRLLALMAFGLAVGSLMALLTVFNPAREATTGDFGGPTPVPDTVSVGNPAPDFSGQTPDGEVFTLAELRGRPVAINFWATWCAPCAVEMPVLQQAYERHADEGFVILAVNAGETPDTVAEFMQERDLTFPALLDESTDIVDLYEVRVFPTTVWVDAEGIVRAEHFGPLTSDLIEIYLEDMQKPFGGQEQALR